ncbi:MAG: right-handed parallel beta-helix repeat-containing protein, partial [Planctomycetes bacterium]|nr:right-handed parallel beta-helix repeat-containing protein [Planctomycetota bacterium]
PETCAAGTCQAGSNPCTVPGKDVCYEREDRCVECLGDGDCKEGETCNQQQQCVSGPDPECENNGQCDDQIVCTDDTCEDGVCVHTSNCPEGQFCDQVQKKCVSGRAIYVDNRLKDDCTGKYSIALRDCTGADGDAYKTIQGAADIVGAGDSVIIRQGTYFAPPGRRAVVELTRGGTDGAPITFANYNDDEVVLDGQGNAIGFYINGRSRPVDHIILHGLTVQRCKSHGIFVRNSSHTRVEYCRALWNEGIGIFIGSGGPGDAGAYQVVQRCEVAYNFRGIQAGANGGTAKPTNVTLQYNHAHHNVDPAKPGNSDGLGCGGVGNDYSIIRGNVIHDNSDDGMDIGQGANFYLIEHNIVYKNGSTVREGKEYFGDGAGIKIGTHGSGMTPGGGHVVRYNVVFNNRAREFDLAGNYRQSSEIGLRPAPCVIYNNTLY